MRFGKIDEDSRLTERRLNACFNLATGIYVEN